MVHLSPQPSLPIILKTSLCYNPVPIPWLVLKRSSSQLLSTPNGDVLLANCLHSTPEVILPELLQFASHPRRQNYYLEKAAGSFLTAQLSRISASRNQRWPAKEGGNLRTNTKLLSKYPYVYKESLGRFQFFFENSLVNIFQCSAALILSSTPEQNCNIFETIALVLIQ